MFSSILEICSQKATCKWEPRDGAEELQLLDAVGRNLHQDLSSHCEVREKNKGKMRTKFFF